MGCFSQENRQAIYRDCYYLKRTNIKGKNCIENKLLDKVYFIKKIKVKLNINEGNLQRGI